MWRRKGGKASLDFFSLSRPSFDFFMTGLPLSFFTLPLGAKVQKKAEIESLFAAFSTPTLYCLLILIIDDGISLS